MAVTLLCIYAGVVSLVLVLLCAIWPAKPQVRTPTRANIAKPRNGTILVEYYRLWDDDTWDTEFIPIPADTPLERADVAVREAADKIQWTDDIPVVVGLYHWPNPDEEPEGNDDGAEDDDGC